MSAAFAAGRDVAMQRLYGKSAAFGVGMQCAITRNIVAPFVAGRDVAMQRLYGG
jgi:hypothetical protein